MTLTLLLSLGSLKTLSQKNSFWVHKVQCQGSEPHLARCPMQMAPPAPHQHACPHGMHTIVSCLPGPAFQKATGKGKKKATPGKVSPSTPSPTNRVPELSSTQPPHLHLQRGLAVYWGC